MFSKDLSTLKKKKKEKEKPLGSFQVQSPRSYPKSKQCNEEMEEVLVQHYLSVCHSKGRWCMLNFNVLLWREPNNPLGMGRPPRKQETVKCIIRLRGKKRHSTPTHIRFRTYFINRSFFSLFKGMDDVVQQKFYLYNDLFPSNLIWVLTETSQQRLV